MQTRRLGRIGIRSALGLLCVLFGSSAIAQTSPDGTSGGGAAPSDPGSSTAPSRLSRFADNKVSIDLDNARLVVAIPELLKTVGAEYIIDADVKNAIISSHLTNVKLHTALDVLMRVSSLPVQYTFDKGVYRFSKRVEAPPQAPPTAAPLLHTPGEAILPPPPTSVDDTIDVYKVQTFDLLRVLNGLFGTPVSIGDPGTNDIRSGNSGSTPPGNSGRGGGAGSGSAERGTQGNSADSQNSRNSAVGPIITLFGNRIQFGLPHP